MVMKQKEISPCIVKACHGNNISSSSGVIFHQEETGLVLTHSSFLFPHTNQSDVTLTLDNEVSFSVTIERYQICSQPERDVKQSKRYELHECGRKTQKNRSLLTLRADFVGSFRCEQFGDDLKKMMPQTHSWKFSEPIEMSSDSKNIPEQNSISESDMSDDVEFFFHMLPVFVILHIPSFKKHVKSVITRPFTILPSLDLAIGSSLYVYGTPFGDSSPHIFINSLSKGILCNRGCDGALLLTDARCIPGEEGAMVFSENHASNQRYLIGLVAVPLCWKAGEWVGLSLVCDMSCILSSLVKNLPEYHEHFATINEDHVALPKSQLRTTIPKSVRSCCVLVRCSEHWGTGLLLDSRTVITCSHVVQEKERVTVHIDGKIARGKRVYFTPPGDPFDLAIVSLEMDLRADYRQLQFASSVTEGDDIFSMGYALFDESCSESPTVTKGIVSKVNRVDGLPVMIQTDSVINQGASGGILINVSGEIIGIVTCNCRDTVTKASYPHVNLAIPASTIMPVVKEYIKTRDVGVLKRLHVSSPAVRQLWSVDLAEEKGLKSKL